MAFEYVKVGDGTTSWSNLPYIAGYPGSTGATGPTGATGAPGTSGGLTLQLDYASITTYSGTPLVGALQSSFVSGTQTSITVPANTTNAKIMTFSIPATSLPGSTAIAGLWDINLYTSVSVPSSPALFYYDVYDGASNIATGTLATATVVNSSTPPQIFTYTLYVPGHTYATNVTINVYVQTASGSTLTIDFRDSSISHLHTYLVAVGSVGSTGPTGPVGTWSMSTVGIPLDAGGPTTNFSVSHYPAFDCGGVSGPADTSFMATMLYTSFMDSWLTE